VKLILPKICCHLILVYCRVAAVIAYCSVSVGFNKGSRPGRSAVANICPCPSAIPTNRIDESILTIVSQKCLKDSPTL
jgi:hypothetical protein